MLKQRRQLFEFLFIICDLLTVSFAWIVAFWLRFYSGFIPVDKGVPPFKSYFSLLIFIWPIWLFVFRGFGLYRGMRGVRRSREILSLINTNAFALLLLIAIVYLFREKDFEFSRLVFLYFGIFATLLTILERTLLRTVLREVRRRGYNVRYVLVVGAGKVASDIAARMRLHPELGLQLLGCLSKDGISAARGLSLVGSYDQLGVILRNISVDQLIFALPLEDHFLLPELLAQVGDSLVDIKMVPDIYQFVRVGGAIEEFEGLPVVSIQGSPLEGVGMYVKRTIDLVIASLAIVFTLPLTLLIAFLIKITSRGPVFYVQERVSFDGTPFRIFKFRTMRVDAERDGPGWSKANDNRVTRIGRFLRATSLDELPQLLNVLSGDMSLVGPRPERPVFIEEFRSRIPRYMLRLKVPAGMTGWAQVNGWRGDTAIDKRIEHDLYYIENWSPLLDFKIMLITIFRGFFNRNEIA
ncbi:MAG TPA: undecaprenyl-phosphate glucose phosphotransferase [Oligoflexia bacterium]|nr:undecaprenyl-phosphate glucose phosphotransferase [Oligoflexia bacterium]HMP27747.1 undecaprenyl-phosphate glucose phosphotransferase [Oligoflexia bacterium]